MSQEEKLTDIREYTSDDIQALKGLEPVRMRPAMYIGDTGKRGLHHLVSEVVDNSIDEAMAGFCTTINVVINADNSITVTDNGRGIPVDFKKEENMSALELVMTSLHAGGKFNHDAYKTSGGLHGVGVSCVNALSTFLRVEVRRNGKIYSQEYSCGIRQTDVIEYGQSTHTGTSVTFKPDASIFTETTIYDYNVIRERLNELAFLNKGVELTLEDKRQDEEREIMPRSERFYSERGLSEYVENKCTKDPVLPQPIHIITEKTALDAQQNKVAIPIEIAFTYTTSTSEHISSFVNNINTRDGGTHVTGFRTALTNTFKKYVDANFNIGSNGQLSKKKDAVLSKKPALGKNGKPVKPIAIDIKGDDFKEGLVAVVSVKVADPQFEGQTKGKLNNTYVLGAVQSAVNEALSQYLEENPKEAETITRKVITAATARIAAEKAIEAVRKQSTGRFGLPGKLVDCISRKPEECELFIVEGDSAGGSAKSGRKAQYQAILPLRGKILNVEKAMRHKVLSNEEIRNIYTALGVYTNNDEEQTLNTDHLRYHKVIIMTDADVDGAHISALILTFFFRYMRTLIEQERVYIANPPLYLCKKGKVSQYCWTEEQRLAFINEYGSGKESGIVQQRFKGLGEMQPEQLYDTTMNPEKRILRKVRVEDLDKANEILEMLMGEEVAPRRAFIEEHAHFAQVDA